MIKGMRQNESKEKKKLFKQLQAEIEQLSEELRIAKAAVQVLLFENPHTEHACTYKYQLLTS
jgi:DNA-binding ferritin-like protein (Dps family)